MKIDQIKPGQIVTVDEVMRARGIRSDDGKGRQTIVREMQRWSVEGHGRFIVGRRGGVSRFEKLQSFSNETNNETETSDETVLTPTVDIGESISSESKVVAHAQSTGHVLVRIPLRRNEKVALSLPANITKPEIDRLIVFLQEMTISSFRNGIETDMMILDAHGRAILPID